CSSLSIGKGGGRRFHNYSQRHPTKSAASPTPYAGENIAKLKQHAGNRNAVSKTEMTPRQPAFSTRSFRRRIENSNSLPRSIGNGSFSCRTCANGPAWRFKNRRD